MQGFSALVAKHPCLLLLLFKSVAIGLSVIAVAAGWVGLSESTGFEWNVETSPESQNQDALRAAELELEFISTGDVAPINRTSTMNMATIYIIYELEPGSDSKTVFNAETLQNICKFEAVFLGHENYDQVCQKKCAASNCECVDQTLSIAYQFYNIKFSEKYKNCTLLTGDEVSQTTNEMLDLVLQETHDGSAQRDLSFYSFFLGKEFGEGDEPANNPVTRTMLKFGGPLELAVAPAGSSTKEIQTILQDMYMNDVLDQVYKHLEIKGALFKSPLANKAYVDVESKQVGVTFHSGLLQSAEFNSIINTDLSAAGISVLFVALYLAIYIRSTFIAAISILQMILSIPASLFFYRAFLGITYFSQMHVLVIFLILGVGADDVLVCFDMWRHLDPALPIADRLHETLMHTRGAVFNTSFTTCVAFISTAISPLMPIAAFGAFAAIAVVLNYVFVLTITPCAIVIHHMYFTRSKTSKTIAPQDDGTGLTPKKSKHDLDFENMPGFFPQKYFPLLNYKLGNGMKPVSWFIVIVGVAFVILMAIFAMKLDTPLKEEQFFSDSHMFTGFYSRMSNNFKGGEEGRYMNLNIVLGISTIERPDFIRWDPGENRGNAVYDSDFTLDTDEAQQSFVKACEAMRNYVCNEVACTQAAQYENEHRLFYSKSSVPCFMDDFLDYMQLKATSSSTTYVPVEGDAFHAAVREFIETPAGAIWGQSVGFDENGKVKVVVIKARASILNSQPNGITVPYYDTISKMFQDEVVALDPVRFKSIYVEAGRNFSWMRTQIELVKGMFSGLAICFPVAFIVLVFATGNILLSIYAVFSIASIVTSVLGCSYLMGWNLGMAESIAAVIVVGFSVDYSVHVSHVYAECPVKSNRSRRVLESLAIMGPTVIAGAITTGGSGVVMFVCQMLFFYKFAIIICLTIALSVVYSLGFFMALCEVAGPQNSTGEISTCLPCLKSNKDH